MPFNIINTLSNFIRCFCIVAKGQLSKAVVFIGKNTKEVVYVFGT